ncbi:MAG: OmpH family outer membrane protein [Paludibacteraceae bacterium]|nr:OmpH family outer membrane protein [Paludibacteraceae bacterium]MBO7635700.1 OmpH family outer membrane protein [Paludibacteraceae bacterium]MBR5972309.1 OmpH family outer membrane protein [Paludibacteraceae bacterium]
MKKVIVAIIALGVAFCASAQKVAVIDMEYVLKNIPMYESANEQLKQVSEKWQKEVEAKNEEAKTLYKNYQTEVVFLSDEMKVKKENEIVAKEKEANELKRKYFGPQGEFYKKRVSLIQPIQDEVYVAVKQVADAKGYQVVLEKSSSTNIIYYTPKIDISDEVLEKLGHSGNNSK